jgi:uncharacterized protein (TIGR00369 family)
MTLSARRSAAEQEALHAGITDIYESLIAFNRVLGHRVLSLDPARPQIRFEMQPALVGHYLYGRLHGGVISATLDVVGSLAVMLAVAEKHPGETTEQVLQRFAKLGTIDLRVDYLRPGLGSAFVADATTSRVGGRLASTQMRLVNDANELIATGAAAYIVS